MFDSKIDTTDRRGVVSNGGTVDFISFCPPSQVGLRPLSTHLDEAPAVREPLPLPEPPAPPVHAGPPLGGQALRWKVPAPPVLGHRV